MKTTKLVVSILAIILIASSCKSKVHYRVTCSYCNIDYIKDENGTSETIPFAYGQVFTYDFEVSRHSHLELGVYGNNIAAEISVNGKIVKTEQTGSTSSYLDLTYITE